MRDHLGRILRGASIAALLLLACPLAALAGTTGKISGRVLDPKKQPLMGVNVMVIGAPLGALTDDAGRYSILNVPAGTYTVKVSLLGYRAVTTTNVSVSADNTTRLDLELAEAPVAMQEVVVSARRPVVEVNRTSTLATVSRDEIKKLPVQELQDVVNLQAGVVEGHFRGGRAGEVQFQVDGVTVNNAYDNTTSLRLDRSLLEEVQVISGTFDAEYGQAMSGVVNAVLRRGTEKFQWDGEVLSGGFLYANGGRRVQDLLWRPAGTANFQLSLSGPTGLPKTTFLLSGAHKSFDDFAYATRAYTPATARGDSSRNPNNKVGQPDGDMSDIPLGQSREWAGIAKVTNRSFANMEFSYQAIANLSDTRRSAWTFHLNPDGRKTQRTVSVVHGLDFTQTLTKKLFYNLSLRQNYWDYHDWKYENVFDPRYDLYGPLASPTGSVDGAYVQGVDFSRFKQNTNAFVAKGAITNQVTSELQFKLGGEFQASRIRFGAPGSLEQTTVAGGNQAIVRKDLGPIPEYMPVFASVYGQEMVEWNDVTVRGGARFEFFDARSWLPSDLENPANSIAGAPQSTAKATSNKMTLSPRIGVSYPISKSAALFFAYGHFYQLPGLGQIFTNSDYSVLRDIQAGESNFDKGIMGNPDIRPEKTVQYQFGYKQAVTPDLGVEMNAFYKDIRDLLGVEFVSTYNAAEYARWTNVDFGSVVGFTVSVDQRAIGPFSVNADYTWQFAQGNTSDPRETATRAEAGEDARPRQIPFNWDQRHTFNLTGRYDQPDIMSLSVILRASSGQPYTPTVSTGGFGNGLETNSGRKPSGVTMDLRAEKQLRFSGFDVSAFGRVLNVFDAKYFNGGVFASTGSPYYSRFPGPDAGSLSDPTRLFAPRRIEVGFTFNRGS